MLEGSNVDVDKNPLDIMAEEFRAQARDALSFPIREKMLHDIYQEAKHGLEETREFANETFGFGIECLIQGEAGHKRKSLSLDAIRERIVAARNAHSKRLDACRVGAARSES